MSNPTTRTTSDISNVASGLPKAKGTVSAHKERPITATTLPQTTTVAADPTTYASTIGSGQKPTPEPLPVVSLVFEKKEDEDDKTKAK